MVDEGQTRAIAEPLLQVAGLAFGYAGQTLLYDVQMQMQSGEMVGLLGPNGSGKTTLLRLLSGLLTPHQGSILLEGRELAGWGRRGIAQRVAVVPQELQVPFAFTVEQMVALGRTPFIPLWGGRTRQDLDIIREAMHLAEVEHLAARVFHELSGGERQRVTLAMALAQQPRLLLLDEPTSHLDIKYQIEMLELIRRLNQETGVTVLAAIHDLNLAARYFPRLLLFQRGIVADGGPAEVLEPHLLQRVYGVAVQVGVMRGAEHLSILPPEEKVTAHQEGQPMPGIHVMAGGGSGALVMRALADAGLPFSAGILNIGDSDHTLALRLATHVISEEPFAPVSEASQKLLLHYLQHVSLLILCPMPIGPGNLALLRAALEKRQQGLPVLCLLPPDLVPEQAGTKREDWTPEVLVQLLNTPPRDYTRGEGLHLLRQIVDTRAIISLSMMEVVEHARQALSQASYGAWRFR